MLNTVVRLEIYKKISGENDYDSVFSDEPFIVHDFSTSTVVYGIEQMKDTVKFTIPIINRVRNNTVINQTYNDYDIEFGDLLKIYAYNYPMTGSLSDHLLMVAFIKNWNFSTSTGKGNISYTAYNRSEVLLNNFMFVTENEGDKVPNLIVEAINRIKTFNQSNIITAYKDYSGLSNPGARGAYDENGNRVYYTIENGTKIYNTSGIGTPETGYIRAYKAAAYDDDGVLLFEGSTVPTTLDDDGRSLYYFKDAVFVETYKAFIDHLEDLSTTKYTDDVNKGAYLYFVDDDNNLHWKPKRFVNTSSRDNETVLVIKEYEETSVSMSKDLNDIVNAIIINCGPDPHETGILTFAFDASSMGKNGAKWKYEAKTDISDSVRQEEIESGSWVNDEGIEQSGGDNYPKYIDNDNYPSDFPWIVQTSGTDDFGNFTYVKGVTEVDDRDEYREYFRNICKLLGKNAGEKLIDYGSQPVLKGSYELEEGSNNYVAGDVFKIEIPSIGLDNNTNIYLRIMSITHEFQGGTWRTTLALEEDRDFALLDV
jgi:hypothetical protein